MFTLIFLFIFNIFIFLSVIIFILFIFDYIIFSNYKEFSLLKLIIQSISLNLN